MTQKDLFEHTPHSPLRKPRVYRVQETFNRDPNTGRTSARDMSSAETYGEIVTIFSHSDLPSLNPDASIRKALSILQDFNPDLDFLVHPGGDAFALMIVTSVLASLELSHINYLRWDRSREDRTKGYYTPTLLDFEKIFS